MSYKIVSAFMHNIMKVYGGVEVQFHAFLILALGGFEWSV